MHPQLVVGQRMQLGFAGTGAALAQQRLATGVDHRLCWQSIRYFHLALEPPLLRLLLKERDHLFGAEAYAVVLLGAFGGVQQKAGVGQIFSGGLAVVAQRVVQETVTADADQQVDTFGQSVDHLAVELTQGRVTDAIHRQAVELFTVNVRVDAQLTVAELRLVTTTVAHEQPLFPGNVDRVDVEQSLQSLGQFFQRPIYPQHFRWQLAGHQVMAADALAGALPSQNGGGLIQAVVQPGTERIDYQRIKRTAAVAEHGVDLQRDGQGLFVTGVDMGTQIFALMYRLAFGNTHILVRQADLVQLLEQSVDHRFALGQAYLAGDHMENAAFAVFLARMTVQVNQQAVAMIFFQRIQQGVEQVVKTLMLTVGPLLHLFGGRALPQAAAINPFAQTLRQREVQVTAEARLFNNQGDRQQRSQLFGAGGFKTSALLLADRQPRSYFRPEAGARMEHGAHQRHILIDPQGQPAVAQSGMNRLARFDQADDLGFRQRLHLRSPCGKRFCAARPDCALQSRFQQNRSPDAAGGHGSAC